MDHVHIETSGPGQILMGTKILSRIGDPLRNNNSPPGTVISDVDLPDDAFSADPALLRSRVFETTHVLDVYPENNKIYFHAWGNLQCCLPGGATSAYVYALNPANLNQIVLPSLKEGDFLIFEEVMGPETGSQADADPDHRQAVRLISVIETKDTVYRDLLSSGELQVRDVADTAMPILKITWSNEDALNFPLCISAETREGDLLRDVSVVRGNIVLSDHGRTIVETHELSEPVTANEPFRLQLKEGPVTIQCQPDTMNYDLDPVNGASPITERMDLSCKTDNAQPAVVLMIRFPTGDQLWSEVPHLLDSPLFAQHFVVVYR